MPDSVFNLELPEKEPAGLWFLRMCIVNSLMSKDYAFTWADFGGQTKAFFHIDPDGYKEEMELSYTLSELKMHLAHRGMFGDGEDTTSSVTVSFGARETSLSIRQGNIAGQRQLYFTVAPDAGFITSEEILGAIVPKSVHFDGEEANYQQ